VRREVKVGLLVLVALAVTVVGIFSVGEKNNLFVRKNTYFIRFESVGGLDRGNPVQLNGVTVGRVEEVVLPEAIEEKLLRVEVSIDRRYGRRVRTDSIASIKTLGLLGDKYVEITSGSPEAPLILSGGEIPAAVSTDMDRLLATSGDLMENVVAVSISLRSILTRVERGEGLLGALLLDTEESQETRASLQSLVRSLDALAQGIERGDGTLGRLLHDDSLARDLESSVTRLDSILEQVENGEGALGVLISDPEGADSARRLLEGLGGAVEELTALSRDLRSAEGLLPRLVNDEELGADISEQLRELVHNLNLVSAKLNEGDGSLAMLLNDPSLYQAIDDILVGVDESKMLRWLVRSRQKDGIEQRYREETAASEGAAESP
jgi:phospholipid/cholesterol/gamma-HCH transport system substrate-binding protein